MKTINTILIMFVFTTIVFSLPEKNPLEIKAVENIIERNFYENYSKINIKGGSEKTKELKFGVEVNLFKTNGFVKLIIDEEVKDFKENKSLYKPYLEKYFLNVIEIVRDEIGSELFNYKIDLMLVTEKSNELLEKRLYID